MKLLRIGEIAKKACVSIRALHHYDEIGLLTPGHVNNVGHRFCHGADIERLEQIVFLKSFGFSLDEGRFKKFEEAMKAGLDRQSRA